MRRLSLSLIYEDLGAFGSEKAAKDKGKFLLAGKDYSVKDV